MYYLNEIIVGQYSAGCSTAVRNSSLYPTENEMAMKLVRDLLDGTVDGWGHYGLYPVGNTKPAPPDCEAGVLFTQP